ncbi:hypothetical protein Sste5346_007692 [Sporothrix stenoceras]|uniref:BZIP domain-containing protein n=1 Tax=Sporothrix stenoceras TaxID=5173 RepID=A0ABR3YSS2_9PEZI
MEGNDTKSGVADNSTAARARRRVCNLTPSQVEKKRAIDRTNQQHWRQKKRLYIAELEAEVARLKESLDASRAKLRVYEGDNDDDMSAEQGEDPSSSTQDLNGESSVRGISAVPAVPSLPTLLPATSRPNNNAIGSASPGGTDGSAYLSSTVPQVHGRQAAAGTGTSSASSDVSWPLSLIAPNITSRARQAGLLSLQSATQLQLQAQAQAQVQAQAHARLDNGLQLDLFETTPFQLYDNTEIDGHVPVDVDEVFGAQPNYTDFLSALDPDYQRQEQVRHQSQNQQQQQQQQQHNPYYRQNIQRYQALYGATPPSPFLTNLSYMPYYLAGRYSAPRPGMPDWMVLPLNMPVATELDKLFLITSQALVQRYSTNEFSQPMFPTIEGLMSRLSTDNKPRSARNSSGPSSSVMGEELLQALAAASAGGASSILSASALTAAARASAVAASAANPPSPADSSSSGDDESSSVIASRPVLAAVATHVVWKSPLKHLTGRLSFLYKLAIYLRWCLCPTKENYEAIPEFLRPTPLQRRVPHPAWVDMIIWPDVRDSLIRGGDYSAFELLRFVLGNTVSINWPYTEAHTFMECADGKRLALNPIFEAHIRNLDNYSVGYQAAMAFPVLSRYVRVT